MRTNLIFCITIFVLSIMLFGCSAQSDSDYKEPAKYSGFMELKAGQWAETVMKGSQGTMKMRVELIENSPDLAKYQIITGEEEVSQIWYDKKAKKAVLYVLESGDNVICVDVDQAPMSYITSDDTAYPADKPDMESGIYTTPTDKEVVVGKFLGSANEVWVSSEVPFGIVKIIHNGQITMQLYDFGTIGAKSLIDSADVAKCSGDPLIVDEQVSEEVTDSWEDDSDFVQADDYDYEEYVETESASDNPDISARTYEAGTGDDVNFECAECEGMPPMAKNACLAACQ